MATTAHRPRVTSPLSLIVPAMVGAHGYGYYVNVAVSIIVSEGLLREINAPGSRVDGHFYFRIRTPFKEVGHCYSVWVPGGFDRYKSS